MFRYAIPVFFCVIKMSESSLVSGHVFNNKDGKEMGVEVTSFH